MPRTRKAFDSIDFNQLSPELWNFEQPLGEGFRCNRGEFTTFWRKGRVKRESDAHIARAFVLQADGRLAAYMTLLADKLQAEAEEPRNP